jgi:hypothetical protein
MFRGTELPRLLFLIAVVLAGWPMFLLYARPQADDRPPPRPLPAAEVRPVVPDEGIEFQALTDKRPIQLRESAAYGELLRRARETPAGKLASSSRRDILYTHLWERPKLYRGVPVHLEGTAKRILTYEVNPELAPRGRLFEAWVYSDENRAFPYVLIFEEPPADLPLGHDLFHRVTFDGYFMKLLSYQAGDNLRAAPMLVGRLHSMPPLAEAPAPMVELRGFFRRHALVMVFGLLFAYLAVRVFFQIRRALAPSRSRHDPSSIDRALPPDQVSEWLENLSDEKADRPPGDHPLRDEIDLHPR